MKMPSLHFDVEGRKYAVTGVHTTEQNQVIDHFKDLETGQQYEVERMTLLNRLKEKQAKWS
jgi:hypothetical protein